MALAKALPARKYYLSVANLFLISLVFIFIIFLRSNAKQAIE